MRKGLSLPLLLIVVSFLLVPLLYWFFVYRTSQPNIKGAKITGQNKGALVVVNSKNGTWELNSYLCENKDSCLSSLTAGSKLDTRNGGSTNSYQVPFNFEDGWLSYGFLKLYIRSGWGSQDRLFKATNSGQIEGLVIEQVSLGESDYNVVLIPTSDLSTGFYKGVEFSD